MKLPNIIPALLMIITCLVSCRPSQEYTLVQYNVGAFNKYDSSSVESIVRVLEELNADAIALNELDSCTNRTGRVEQLSAFAQEMGDWNSHFAAAMQYDGGAYGVGLAVSPALVLIRTDKVPLPQMDGYEPRVMAVSEYDRFVLASTHLDFASREARMAQVSQINHYMDSVYADSRKPIFLCGDFNCLPESEPISLLKQTWQQISPSEPTYPADSPAKCIDYIFVRPNGHEIQVNSAFVPTSLTHIDLSTASDHLPVVVNVTIKRLHP